MPATRADEASGTRNAAEGEIHGAAMSAELARHGHQISPGTLYPTLHRLYQNGLLTCRDEVRHGRRIRLYRITPAGRDTLNQMRNALRELASEILAER